MNVRTSESSLLQHYYIIISQPQTHKLGVRNLVKLAHSLNNTKSGLRRVRNARMFIWRPNFEMITSQNVVDTIQMRYAGARG